MFTGMGTREMCHENHQKVMFAINVDYVAKIDCEVALLDTCEVISDIPYLWDRDATFYKKEKKYHLVKGGKAYLIKSPKGRGRISLLGTKQGKTQTRLLGVGSGNGKREWEQECQFLKIFRSGSISGVFFI
jgi:hypothetical protein